MKKYIFGHFLVGVVAIAAFGAVVMWLWNALVPSILGVVAINFWQALGLLVLSRILFGSFGGKFHKFGRHHGHDSRHPLNPLREKWHAMTPEERKEFIKKRRYHPFAGCGCDPYAGCGCDDSLKDQSNKTTTGDDKTE